MAIKKYVEGEAEFWQVYVDVRSRKDRSIRLQKRINRITSEKEAQAEERRLVRELALKLSELETKGVRWGEVIDRWIRHQELFPTKRLAQTTIEDYSSLLRNWTKPWLERTAAEINRADAREIMIRAQDAGKRSSFCKHLKNTINLIYSWGMEERLIGAIHGSPVQGLEIDKDREEKVPEILTVEEIRTLLRKAQEQQHPWYPIWVSAALTGCRSGELQALVVGDVEIVSREEAGLQESLPPEQRKFGAIRIRRNWNARLKEIGPTKAGYWRTVPVSGEFYWFLMDELKVEQKSPDQLLLPRFTEWKLGYQATILRGFCEANRLPSIKFHTLRACFATQLIGSGVPPTIVMKICGWKDMKTMQRYIRLAGIDESGATERLRFITEAPKVIEDHEVIGKVVSMLGRTKT